MILNTPFSGQRAESNQNVPYLIPLSLSVIRFSQHSWWTEWNSGIPAKVFRTHKAQWNSDVVSKCGAEPPLTSDSECIIILCVYCFTADCLVSIVPTGWPLTCSSACFGPTVSARAQVECVLMRGKNLTCYLPTKYNNGMFHGALASWWMCSHTHAHDSRSLQALWYICYQCGRVLENSLSITTGSVRMRERERERDRRLWWKKRGRDQNVKKQWKRDTAVSGKSRFRCSMLECVRVFWKQCIYARVYASLSFNV